MHFAPPGLSGASAARLPQASARRHQFTEISDTRKCLLLIWLCPSGFVVVPLGMLLSAPFWWGFDLPFAWLSAALVLPILAAAWAVYRKASCHPGESRRSSA